MRIGALSLISLTLFSLIFFYAAAENIIPPRRDLSPSQGVDLGIADDETFKRPNSWGKLDNKKTDFASNESLPTERILFGDFSGPASRPGMSIAWRNAAQVEEVEVRVRNLGSRAGEGEVWVDILDEVGNLLLRLTPPEELKIVRIPAYENGGREGKILRMKSSRELNNIIDQFDRDRRRYDVKATVRTIGDVDSNLQDNTKAKSWNVPHRVQPGFVNAFNYKFKNTEAIQVRVKWLFERTPYPDGWMIEGIPESDEPFILEPGEELQGTLIMRAPMRIQEGAFLEARLTLLGLEDNSVWQQREWFQVYDTVPPTVSNYRLVATSDHRIGIQVLVSDEGSGVLEATGVSTQYSTDGGLTWSTRAHNYKAGNFVVPTLFESVLGPFAPDTKLQIRFTAKDTAGNSTAIIPQEAVGIRAPSGAEKLLDLATVFPRTQPNAIYSLDPGVVDIGQVAAQFAVAIANAESDPKKMREIEALLSEVPIDDKSKEALLDAADRLATDSSRKIAAQRLRDVVESMPATPAGVDVVEEISLERIDAPGTDLLRMSTIGLTIQ